MERLPFIFGSQYYRAPTPEPECWSTDFPRMRDLGFNTLKYFVQWRWSHRSPDRYYFADLDKLMDLAHAHGLQVNLNAILDVSPTWLLEAYPDAKQVDARGRVIEPYAVSHRSVGGHPGPCYNNPDALAERRRFMREVYEHFRSHPALWSWDVWNEPELCFPQREPNMQTLACYCRYCHETFGQWLATKYGDLERLNEVWGRCYTGWEQVEMPRDGGTVTDFVDWREFHLDTLTNEARWRLDLARECDPDHPCYLHVVPNTMTCFSSVTCVDDFALAELCDCFAASMNGGAVSPPQVISAARGKVCYNVESHLNHGYIGMHQRRLGLADLLMDWLPQIGFGVKGFLFWQYRPEVLGAESPAWGVVNLQGEDRPITRAVRTFWETLSPHVEDLLAAQPEPAKVGILKSRRNEICQFGTQGSLAPLVAGVEAYIHALYWRSYPFRIISERMLERRELDGVRFLILPACYYLTEPEAEALDAWVHAGGVALCEAHLAGYNGTAGRHSRSLPGCRLAESWGIREADSTSSYHLRLAGSDAPEADMPPDVSKALRDFGTSGASHYPIRLTDGTYAWGASRYAVLEGDDVATDGSFDGAEACIVSKPVGDGFVMYAGTNLGEGSSRGAEGLWALLSRCLARAGIRPALGTAAADAVHVDVLGPQGAPCFLVIHNRRDEPADLRLDLTGSWRGLFSQHEFRFDPPRPVRVSSRFVDMFVPS